MCDDSSNDEFRIAFLRPREILARLAQCPTIYIPVGGLEWHGLHLPFGVDPLNAESVAMEACRRTGGIVWQTLFWGTERERPGHQLANMGFRGDEYVLGMDHPANVVPSAYCSEEIFALLVREVLREVAQMGARLAVIVNGHGSLNQMDVLDRLAIELNHTTDLRVHAKLAMPKRLLDAGEGDHAAAGETSLMMYLYPQTVRLEELPSYPEPITYKDHGVADASPFLGTNKGPALPLESDPRVAASAEKGRKRMDETISELVNEVRDHLNQLG